MLEHLKVVRSWEHADKVVHQERLFGLLRVREVFDLVSDGLLKDVKCHFRRVFHEVWITAILNKAVLKNPAAALQDEWHNLTLALLEQVSLDNSEEFHRLDLTHTHVVKQNAPKVASVDVVNLIQVSREEID